MPDSGRIGGGGVVWIDPGGLRGLAGELAALREDMAPVALPASPTPSAVPSAVPSEALQASIASFNQLLLQACTDSAQQVDSLAADACMAAARWADTDQHLDSALRAVPR